MAVKRRPTTYQYEPLVTPSKWQGDELRFSVRLTQILDDLYQKFSSLRTGSGSASVAIADDANKLGGVEASKYALKTGTVANANKLGGKAPEYYLSPRNLLDNSDFRNPVNQREIITSGVFTYFIDRWITGSAGCTLSENGVNLVSNCWLHQRIAKETFDAYLSNGFTFCCETSDGTVLTLNTVAGSGSGAINGVHLYVANDYLDIGGYYEFRIVTDVNTTCTVKWAALYEGEYTAETLPPYVPKGYAAELAECQRYAVPITDQMRIRAASIGANTIEVFVPLPTMMRTGGLPSIDSSAFAVMSTLQVVQSDFTFTVVRCDGNGMLLRGTKNAHGLSDGEIRTTVRTIVSRDL